MFGLAIILPTVGVLVLAFALLLLFYTSRHVTLKAAFIKSTLPVGSAAAIAVFTQMVVLPVPVALLLPALALPLLVVAAFLLDLPKYPLFGTVLRTAAIASVITWAWWVIVLVANRSQPEDCGPAISPDGLCLSLTTVGGNVGLGTFMALLKLLPLWVALLGSAIVVSVVYRLLRGSVGKEKDKRHGKDD